MYIYIVSQRQLEQLTVDGYSSVCYNSALRAPADASFVDRKKIAHIALYTQPSYQTTIVAGILMRQQLYKLQSATQHTERVSERAR